MAERKKSSDKTKSSVRPTTAKPEAEVIDGAAVEKMAGEGSVTSNNAATKSENQTSIATTSPLVINVDVPKCGLGDCRNRCCGGIAGAIGICCCLLADS